jgi:hypothetical protein
MKKTALVLFLGGVLGVVSISSHAADDKKMYFGVAATANKLKVGSDGNAMFSGTSGKFDGSKKTAVELKFGYMYNQYVGVEVVLPSGKISQDKYITGTRLTNLSYNPRLAVYAKGVVDVNPDLGLYGLLGFQSTKIDARLRDTGTDVLFSGTRSAVAYGVGVNYAVGGVVLDASYRAAGKIELKDGSKVSELSNDGFSLGVNFRF